MCTKKMDHSIKCAECKFETYSMQGLAKHANAKHNKAPRLYYDLYLRKDKSEGLCVECGLETTFLGVGYGYQTICSSVKCCQKRIKDVTNARYGVDNVFQVKEFQDKTKKTTIERYGVEYISQSEDIMRKITKTRHEKYGDHSSENFLKSSAKRKETMLKKYGVEYPAQNKASFQKALDNGAGRIKRKKYQTKFGNVISTQGKYEEGFVVFCDENSIKIENGPAIKYNHLNKEHKYFVDFKIIVNDTISLVEIKSTYWYQKYKDIVDIKSNAAEKFCNDMGWKFYFFINDGARDKQIAVSKFEILIGGLNDSN